MKTIFAFITISILLLGCNVVAQKNQVLVPDEFEKWLITDIQLLDVRTAEEYKTGHINNCLQADWRNEKEFKERIVHLDKQKTVLIYCQSGPRSNAAADWMRNNGFKEVIELKGGMIAWKTSNKPVVGKTMVTEFTITDIEKMITSGEFVLLDFGAEWCPPCKKMEPVLNDLVKNFGQKFTLQKIDAGIHTTVMKTLGVESLPTFILYYRSKEVWRKQGLVSYEAFSKQLQQTY